MSEAGINAKDIRESAIAGTWYPGDPGRLAKEVDDYLDKVPDRELPGTLLGLVAPHAGYVYSGQVAAYSYKLLKGKSYPTVIVLSPSHRPYYGGVLVTKKRYYRTPLGLVEVAVDLVERVHEQMTLDFIGQDQEHSLEIQLPFLQMVLPEFKLVPLMMENQSIETCQGLAQVLAGVFSQGNALFVASSDLSHFYDYDRAAKLDRRALEDIERYDAEGFARDVATGKCEACGAGPIATVLLATKALGGDKVTILKYANSGDVTGDRWRVVGYGAAAVTRSA